MGNSNDQIVRADIKHMKALDALRGIAVLGVVLVHSAATSRQHGVLLNIGFVGQRGVQLFYVISAFTLFYSMGVRKVEQRPLLNFFIRRFFRIAPLYYLAIILNLLLQGFAVRPDVPDGLSIYEVIAGFLFLNGLSPHAINAVAIGGWSIAVETTFYILVPFLFLRIDNFNKALKLTIISAIVVFVATRVINHFTDGVYGEFLFFLSFPIEFPIFCMGILTFMIWKYYSKLKANNINFNELQVKTISFLFLLLTIIIVASNFPFLTSKLYFSSVSFIFLVLALLIYEWPLLVNRFTLYLGKISYSIYLMHFFVLYFVEKIATDYFPSFYGKYVGKAYSFPILFIVILILSCILSTITFHLIEKPGIKMGRKLIEYFNKPKSKERTVSRNLT